MDTKEKHEEQSKQQANVGVFDSNNMQCLIIVKRLKSLALALNLSAEESGEDIFNKNINTRTKLLISPFWSCHAHSSCSDCEVCCSCVLKMFVEMHLLSERDNVGDNYVAVSNIINGLMRKLAYQNELQKKRKEAEENKKKISEQRRESEGKTPAIPAVSEEIINWPDDLSDLIDNWDNLPENQGKNMIKTVTPSEVEQLLRVITEPNQSPPNVTTSHVMRGWPLHRQAMIARPLISQINNRAFINRTVIPRPILTHPITSGGRPLMSHIVSGGRHHIMSQIVAGRPILNRVISGHSLMGHMVTAQSLMNHANVGNRNILQNNSNSVQFLQNHMARQLNHNLTFVNYNRVLQPRPTDNNNNANKKK